MKVVFEHINEPFKFLFEDCQVEFRTEVYRKAKYRMFAQDCQQRDDEELKSGEASTTNVLWFQRVEKPVVEEAGKYSK